MSDPIFQRTAFPDPLVTLEDYKKACQDFVMPFLAERSGIITELIEKLQVITNEKDWKVDEELLKAHIKAIKKASSFPEDINEFMDEVKALEQKLEDEGAFDEESS
jgi:hypothetical protein